MLIEKLYKALFSLLVGAIGVFSITLIRWAFGLFCNPLRDIPGPFWARFTNMWYFYGTWNGHFHELNLELHRQHGAIVRYGPSRYTINDPEAAKSVYGLGKHFAKSDWYSTTSIPGQWSLFSDQDIARHAQNRKLYQSTYAMSSLVHYEPFVDKCTALLAQRLAETYDAKSNAMVDMRRWFQCYAFDVMGEITYGRRLGFLDCGEDIGNVMSALDYLFAYGGLVGVFPSLHRLLFPIQQFFSGTKGSGRAFMKNFTRDRIHESRSALKFDPAEQGSVTTEDFLTKFLAKHVEYPTIFTDYHILSACMTNMVAGSDTTAISLSSILYHLLKNPTTFQALRDEVDRFCAEGKLSASPTFKESQQMPYLQAVIKEALRVHPVTGVPLERVVPKGGAQICGRFFPEGTIIGMNPWVVHRNPYAFGDDAELFKPERWLVEDKDKLAVMNGSFMPFGTGSRTCIGRHVSMLEMCKLIPLLVRDFDFRLHPMLERSSWKTQNWFMVKPLNFHVQVKIR